MEVIKHDIESKWNQSIIQWDNEDYKGMDFDSYRWKVDF